MSTTGDVNPDGTGKQPDFWDVGDALSVGLSGSGALTVEGVGVVSSTNGFLGWKSGSAGEAIITGSAARWHNSEKLTVGFYGEGALTVAAQGEVSNTEGTIGEHTGSTGEVTVTGLDSHWSNSSWLTVGDKRLEYAKRGLAPDR
jgi:autotransporter family porin